MYKVLSVLVVDNGSDPDKSINSAGEALSAKVAEAEAEGWSPCGGLQTLSRQKPHGLFTWFLQAMGRMDPKRLEAMLQMYVPEDPVVDGKDASPLAPFHPMNTMGLSNETRFVDDESPGRDWDAGKPGSQERVDALNLPDPLILPTVDQPTVWRQDSHEPEPTPEASPMTPEPTPATEEPANTQEESPPQEVSQPEPRRRGRPPGSKNQRSTDGTPEQMTITETVEQTA